MDTHFEVLRQTDAASAAAEAGEHLNQALIENKKRPVLLMLSGGSALSILDYVGPNALGENLTVSMLDERFSQDSNINNFLQLQKTDFYKDALDAGASFYGSLPRPNETMAEVAQRMEKNLCSWREENPTGIIIGSLGMGPDGHTAGIFANDDEKEFETMFSGDDWVTSYNAGTKSPYPERITTTLTFLKEIDTAFAFACGTGKKQKLDELITNNTPAHKLPAVIWHEIKEVKVFTDLQ